MEAKLIVLEGNAKGREIPLPSTQFIIGRDSTCHLRPHSGLVSKLHCAIGRQNGRVVVRDLKSRNKTYINDESISSPTYVKDGDILTVGPVRFRFQITADEGVSSDIQKIRPDRVRWLMESSESYDVNPGADTTIELPVDLASDEASDQHDSSSSLQATEAGPNGEASDTQHGANKNMSAGQYLHDYFQTRNDTGREPPGRNQN